MKKICLTLTSHWLIYLFAAIFALAGLLYTPKLNAEIYKWIDENGVIHYGNVLPTNTENVKIVSREYQHDEAADQKRVKADQKKMNALTDKKEEQQASVEEQKKLEASKQKQTPSGAEETKADTSCYLEASVDVIVEVWNADDEGNKGYRIWRGLIKQGKQKHIISHKGLIRYASSKAIGEREPPLSGDTDRSCQNGEIIGVP